MTRRIRYANQLAISLFDLQDQKEFMIELAQLAMGILGTSTAINDFECVPNVPADLGVQVGTGALFSYQNVDDTAFGTAPTQIPADTVNKILKMAYKFGDTPFTFVPPTTVGFSRNDLIQISFLEQDGALTSVPFFNGAGLPPVFQSVNVQRIDSVVISVVTGVAAATGTQVTPSPTAGFTGMWVVTTTQGQTQITGGDINRYPTAPFLLEKLQDKISQASADTRYVQKTDFQFSTPIYALDTGTTDNLVVALNPTLTTYGSGGLHILCKVANANTGPVVIDADGLGNVSVVNQDGSALQGGQMTAGMIADLIFDGTNMQFMNPGQQTRLPGFIDWFAGITSQPGWLVADGTAVSRTTYSALFSAITFTQSCTLSSGSNVITVSNSNHMFVGMRLTGSGIPSSTTITTIAGTNVTISNNATSTGSSTVRFYPHGAGDGSTTFNTPNLAGCVPIGAGTSPFLTDRITGQTGGEEAHTLTNGELTPHSHQLNSTSWFNQGSDGLGFIAANQSVAGRQVNATASYPGFVTTEGGGAPFNVMNPYLVLTAMVKT